MKKRIRFRFCPGFDFAPHWDPSTLNNCKTHKTEFEWNHHPEISHQFHVLFFSGVYCRTLGTTHNTPKLSTRRRQYWRDHITRSSSSNKTQYPSNKAPRPHTNISDSLLRGYKTFFFELEFFVVGSDGHRWTLKFSIPFNQICRTFWPQSSEQSVQSFESIVWEHLRL